MSRTSGDRPRKHRGGRARSEPRAICGHPRKRGGLCRRAPGTGTDHYGVGPCAEHGGNDKRHLKAALAMASVSAGGDSLLWEEDVVMGVGLDIAPIDVLTYCIKVAAGEVVYLSRRIAEELGHDQLFDRPTTDSREVGEGEKGHKDLRKRELGPQAPHLLIEMRWRAMDRAARLSKMALDAGVAERQVQLAEREGDLIASTIEAVMSRLGLTAKQTAKLETILPEVLLELEGGAQVLAS